MTALSCLSAMCCSGCTVACLNAASSALCIYAIYITLKLLTSSIVMMTRSNILCSVLCGDVIMFDLLCRNNLQDELTKLQNLVSTQADALERVKVENSQIKHQLGDTQHKVD